MSTETTKNSICAACPHGIAMHFANAIGDVVCLVTGVNNAWGIPSATHCDCYNYDSPQTRNRLEREKRDREQDERRIQEMVAKWQPITPEETK